MLKNAKTHGPCALCRQLNFNNAGIKKPLCGNIGAFGIWYD